MKHLGTNVKDTLDLLTGSDSFNTELQAPHSPVSSSGPGSDFCPGQFSLLPVALLSSFLYRNQGESLLWFEEVGSCLRFKSSLFFVSAEKIHAT